MGISAKRVKEEVDQAVADLGSMGTLNIAYYPAAVTEDVMSQLQGEGRPSLILPALHAWDFWETPPQYDTDGQTLIVPGVPMPINAESLKLLGISNGMKICRGIIDNELKKMEKSTQK